MELAPLNVPMHRRMETLAALVAMSLFFMCIAFFAWCLMRTWTWPFLIAYAAWIHFDNSPEVGGRRVEWIRKGPLWRYLRDYFPCRLVKSEDLDASKNYIFCYHPHGILSTGMWVTFCTEALDISGQFPGIRIHPLTLVQNFKIPFWREILLWSGLCSVSRKSCDFLLGGGGSRGESGAGNSILIVPGGAREALDAREGTARLTLKKRKGFIKVALVHGSPLVPVFGFGENEIYSQIDNSEGTLLHRFQSLFLKHIGIAPCMPYGRGVFQYNYGFLPKRRAMNIAVGRALIVPKIDSPTSADIEKWHELYVERLMELWDTYKDEFAPDRKEELKLIR